MRIIKKSVTSIMMSLIIMVSLIFSNISVVSATNTITAYLLGIYDSDGQDRTSWIPPAKASWSNIENVSVSGITSFTSTQLGTYLKAATVLLILTHGSQTTLRAVSGSNVTRLYCSDIDSWSSNALSNMDIFASMACRNGEGGITATNIVNSIYNKGASVSIGATADTYNPQAGVWLQSFSARMDNNGTVAEAMLAADTNVLLTYSDTGGTSARLVRGDQGISY